MVRFLSGIDDRDWGSHRTTYSALENVQVVVLPGRFLAILKAWEVVGYFSPLAIDVTLDLNMPI